LFLWIAFIGVWIIAFFAILFTGRFPRGLFDFNVGVMRWTWRVGFYSYDALGTDRYPPFTLKSVDYPADLQIEYPEKLSRGLVLVKWWLLAIPHYIIVAFFMGGWKLGQDSRPWVWDSCPWAWNSGSWQTGNGEGVGLVLILVVIAAIALLFTGKYHGEIFRLIVGMNRWAYRTCAYVALMTDQYPPFRLWDD